MIVKILNGLYISDMYITTEIVKKYRISGILNCTPDVPSRTDVETIRVPVEDSLESSEQFKFKQYIPVATTFIHKIRNLERSNVIVHCIAGKQRSAAFIVAYLIMYCKMDLSKAIRFVLCKHPKAFNEGKHVNFLSPLKTI